MPKRSLCTQCLLAFALILAPIALARAQEKSDAKETEKKDTASAPADATSGSTSAAASTAKSASPTTTSPPKHAALLKDAKPHTGLFTLYQKGNKLYAELSSGDYNSEYIVLISIARGIAQRPLLGGYSWGFGDDWVWKFRKIDDRVHVIRRNVRFKANAGTPEATAVKNAYTDSVLFSLPVLTKGPKGGDLIDLSAIFMSDLPQISQVLPGFMFSSTKSSWASIKAFTDNIQLQVAATYSSSGRLAFDSVADSRGVTLNVHYSVSKLPSTGYVPRLADDRVGYFLTVVKDYSKKSDRDRFVRYINRWQLQKPPGAGSGPTPPKEPIVFWIEKTVPFKYRKAVREGIEEWNKAFEAAGWLNAIEVRQQPDDATWDPEDINYNTFRWITSDAGFAMGPSRVNPYTGQILDADIIFDADFLQFWKQEFETLDPHGVAAMTGGAPADASSELASPQTLLGLQTPGQNCVLSEGMSRQLAFGAVAMASVADPKQSAELQDKMIMQGLMEVTMHEVGHTLGLRHNFKASRLLSLKDLNDRAKVQDGALVASVMDYSPTNVVPKGWKQGDFFTRTIGPYDKWAIEYGYAALSGGTQGELKNLQKIATRSAEPALAYATDEDTTGLDPDPESNRFDLGNDSLEYARVQSQLVEQLIPGLVERMTKEGDDYTQARRAFNILLAQHGQAMYFASRYVGGLNTSRSHKGDKGAKPPIEVVDVKKQRAALALLEKNVLSDKPYQFPAEMYGYLASSRWNHWGTSLSQRKDFPVHDYVLMWQTRILGQLLSSTTLERIHDTELKVPADKDVLTAAELIERLTKAVFLETQTTKKGQYTNRKPAISSLRRNLQRSFVRQLSNLAMGRGSAPADCQAIAYVELSALQSRIQKLLDSKVKLDNYSRAHLQESADRIGKVLDAKLSLSGP